MITKERLEEIREKDGKVFILIDGKPMSEKLNSLCLQIGYVDNKEHFVLFDIYDRMISITNEDLFETKEDAEFALRFKRIPRTEHLDLPTWEEFNKNSYFQFVSKDMSNVVLAESGYLEIDEYIDGEFVQTYFHKEMNKENYLLACELCRKLWLGEKV